MDHSLTCEKSFASGHVIRLGCLTTLLAFTPYLGKELHSHNHTHIHTESLPSEVLAVTNDS